MNGSLCVGCTKEINPVSPPPKHKRLHLNIKPPTNVGGFMKGFTDFTICYTYYFCRDHSPDPAARLHLRKVTEENLAAVSVLRSQTQTTPLILIIFNRPATRSLCW